MPSIGIGIRIGGGGRRLDPSLPTSYAGLLAGFEAPPKSLIATPDAYVMRTLPSVTAPNDVTAWSRTDCTTPDTQTVLTANDVGVSRQHYVSQAAANIVTGRKTILQANIQPGGTWDYCFVEMGGASNDILVFRISTRTAISVGADISAYSITDAGGGVVAVSITCNAPTSATIFIGTAAASGAISFAGTGTESIKVSGITVTQDGVVNTQLDLRTRWPGLYRSGGGPAIDPSTGLPYAVYDATQGTFANCPYYRGQLSAQWSTGAPTIYNPGNATGISLALASGLVSKLAGSGTPFEVIALIKLFATSAASDSALLKLLGGFAQARMISQKGAAGLWGRRRVDDGGAHSDDTAFTDAVAAEEVLVRHVFTGSSDKFYKGAAAPLTADASNPLASTAINCSFTSGQIFYNGAATALAMSMRGMWIRTPSTDADADAIAAGILARSAATA